MHQQQKRPQCLLMLGMNPDSLHTLSTDTSFCKLLIDDIKTLRFGGRHSRSWSPGDSKPGSSPMFRFPFRLPPVDFEPVFNSIRENRVELDLSPVLQAIQDTCPIFFGAEIPQSHKVTWSDVKMLNSLIVFLGFFNLGSERERGYAEPVWWHFGRD